MNDEEFDALLDPLGRARSSRFFTPAAVAACAAGRLEALAARRVLDVGAGLGKFCLLAAKSAPTLEFVGIERRGWLVAEAERLRVLLGLTNVRFQAGDALESELASYDALYFFNPFSEHLVAAHEQLDTAVELSRERYAREMMRLDLALRILPRGKLLVTYHGIAGPIPSSYDLVSEEPVGTNQLRIWRRSSRRERAWIYLETDEGVVAADRRQFLRILLAQGQ